MDPALHARAKKIIDQVLDLPEESRGVALDAACSGDPKLRMHIDALLAAIVREDRFLSGPTMMEGARASIGTGLSAGVGAGASGTRPEGERAGARIGPYKLLEKIGEGGFGTVFMAEQSVPIHRRVALKIIKLGMDTRAVVARFEQERQALAMMDHPNIAKVLDAGATELGRPFFVMELVKGEPITVFADAKKLGIRQRLELFTQVCRAVQHAHTKGIIHRDIKPTNVLVTVTDGKPLCKVIDFGIAKATQRPLTDKTIFTEFKQLVGTPEYMSPEQAAGSLDIDTRTDVYSLGVMLYELLAGVTPFDPERLRSAAFGELQRIIREDEPPRPSTRVSAATEKLSSIAAVRDVEPKRLGAIIRGELDWIVMRALEKNCARRYQTAENLAADVQRYLDGGPVEAAPASVGYRAAKFLRRYRVPAIAGAAMLLLLVGGVVGTSVGLVRASRAAEEARRSAATATANATLATENASGADQAAEEARRNAQETEAVDALMNTMIGSANRGKQQGRADVTVREVMDKAAKELHGGRWKNDPRIEARLAKAIGEVYRELSMLEPAEEMLRLHVQRQKEIHGAKSREYGESLSDFGGLVKARGDFDGAQRVYDQAKEVFGPLGDDVVEEIFAVQLNEAALAASRGNWEASEKTLREIVAGFEKRGAAERSPPTGTYVLAVRNLAATLYQRQALDESEACMKKSIALRRAVPGEIEPDIQVDLHNLGALQFARGNTQEAIKTMREEVAFARRLYGDKHLEVADALTSLAVVLGRLEDFDAEVAAEREALAIQTELLTRDHPTVAHTRHMLGGGLLSQKKYEEAETELREARDISIAKLGPSHYDGVFAGYELALAMQHRGGPALANAEAVLRETLDGAKDLGKDAKYAWMRYAVTSLLGGILVDQAALPAAEDVAGKLREAEALETVAMEKLPVLMAKSGPRTRRTTITAALERITRLYTVWNQIEPTQERAAKIAEWQKRLDEFKTNGK